MGEIENIFKFYELIEFTRLSHFLRDLIEFIITYSKIMEKILNTLYFYISDLICFIIRFTSDIL